MILVGLRKCWSLIKHSFLVWLKILTLPGNSLLTFFVYGRRDDTCRTAEMLESDKA